MDTAGVEYRLVNPAEWIERAKPLLEANWAETGFGFDFEPDAARYGQLHDAGVLFALAALDGDELVGYCTIVVSPHLFNAGVLVAAHDALYVVPERRGGTVPARLIDAAEAEAARRGASRFCWHTRAGTGLGRMLEKRGYEPADVVVMKEL